VCLSKLWLPLTHPSFDAARCGATPHPICTCVFGRQANHTKSVDEPVLASYLRPGYSRPMSESPKRFLKCLAPRNDPEARRLGEDPKVFLMCVAAALRQQEQEAAAVNRQPQPPGRPALD
jgi:hypothetical protein